MSLLESFEVVVLVAAMAILMWDNRLSARDELTARRALPARPPRNEPTPPR